MPRIKTPNPAASNIKVAFAARLRALRLSLPPPEDQKELSQADFAKLLGLEAETYRRYERGETEPPLAVLARLRAVTGASLNSLVAGEIDRAA